MPKLSLHLVKTARHLKRPLKTVRDPYHFRKNFNAKVQIQLALELSSVGWILAKTLTIS